jgi:hypothetical protein
VEEAEIISRRDEQKVMRTPRQSFHFFRPTVSHFMMYIAYSLFPILTPSARHTSYTIIISMAMNLIKMMAIRNGFHRTPCVPDGEKYHEFENSFPFDPTDDQFRCFQVRTNSEILSMIYPLESSEGCQSFFCSVCWSSCSSSSSSLIHSNLAITFALQVSDVWYVTVRQLPTPIYTVIALI